MTSPRDHGEAEEEPERRRRFAGAVAAFCESSAPLYPPAVVDRSRSLYDVCELLSRHRANPASTEDAELAAAVAFLRGRLQSWAPNREDDPRRAYDEAMRSLCEAALALFSK